MKKTKPKKRLFLKIRILVLLIIFGTVTITLSGNLLSNFKQLIDMKEKKIALQKEKVKLAEEEEKLESDVKKLRDSDYIARYVREKYLYSKNGELIIRIEENTEN